MQLKALAATVAVIAAASLTGTAPASAATAPPKRNLVQTATAAGQFTTLTRLVTAAGLAHTLAGRGQFTVFAPTDAAFARVPPATINALLRDRARLRAVLLYHVLGRRVFARQVVNLRSARTLNGQRVRFTANRGVARINGVRIVRTNVRASNGVIHVINRVLIPR